MLWWQACNTSVVDRERLKVAGETAESRLGYQTGVYICHSEVNRGEQK